MHLFKYNQEELLSTDSRFMLGPWLEMAKALGRNDEEKALYEYNARNQVSIGTYIIDLSEI